MTNENSPDEPNAISEAILAGLITRNLDETDVHAPHHEVNLVDVVYRGAQAIEGLSRALHRLGTNDAATNMGAIENLAGEIRDGSGRIADALNGIATSLDGIAEAMTRGQK